MWLLPTWQNVNGFIVLWFGHTQYMRRQRADLIPASSLRGQSDKQGPWAAVFKQDPHRKLGEEAAVCWGLSFIRTRWFHVFHQTRIWGYTLKPLNIWENFFKTKVSNSCCNTKVSNWLALLNLVWHLCRCSRKCCHQSGLISGKKKKKRIFSIPQHMDADNMLATGFILPLAGVWHENTAGFLHPSALPHILLSCSEHNPVGLAVTRYGLTWVSPDLTRADGFFSQKPVSKERPVALSSSPLVTHNSGMLTWL